jgi:hypothetical protein
VQVGEGVLALGVENKCPAGVSLAKCLFYLPGAGVASSSQRSTTTTTRIGEQ